MASRSDCRPGTSSTCWLAAQLMPGALPAMRWRDRALERPPEAHMKRPAVECRRGPVARTCRWPGARRSWRRRLGPGAGFCTQPRKGGRRRPMPQKRGITRGGARSSWKISCQAWTMRVGTIASPPRGSRPFPSLSRSPLEIRRRPELSQSLQPAQAPFDD